MLSSAWMRYCLILWTLDVHLCSRSPQGERGLKLFPLCRVHSQSGRSPQGERGLKLWINQKSSVNCGRSPQGERGLKSFRRRYLAQDARSLSARGAWIEMLIVRGKGDKQRVALRKGSVD